MRRIDEAFEAQRHHTTAHLRLSQEVADAVRNRGRLETHRGVLQKVKGTFTSIWSRWQHDEMYKKSQLLQNWTHGSGTLITSFSLT